MLIGGSRREQVLFAGVMKELLAPINNPRYVIIGKEWGVRAYCVSFPCSSVFARRQQDAEILRRNKLRADRADEHHAEGSSCAYAVGAAPPVLHTGGNEDRQRHDGQQYDRSGDGHVHNVLKCAGIAAA